MNKKHIKTKQEFSELKDRTNTSSVTADSFESRLEEIINKYINGINKIDCSTVEKRINELPANRDAALVILQLITSFDGVIELYEALFARYTKFLTKEELDNLIDLTKRTWDPDVWETWMRNK